MKQRRRTTTLTRNRKNNERTRTIQDMRVTSSAMGPNKLAVGVANVEGEGVGVPRRTVEAVCQGASRHMKFTGGRCAWGRTCPNASGRTLVFCRVIILGHP